MEENEYVIKLKDMSVHFEIYKNGQLLPLHNQTNIKLALENMLGVIKRNENEMKRYKKTLI